MGWNHQLDNLQTQIQVFVSTTLKRANKTSRVSKPWRHFWWEMNEFDECPSQFGVIRWDQYGRDETMQTYSTFGGMCPSKCIVSVLVSYCWWFRTPKQPPGMGFQLPFPQLVSLPDFWTINSRNGLSNSSPQIDLLGHLGGRHSSKKSGWICIRWLVWAERGKGGMTGAEN